jgi:hypothetical protein
MGTAGHVQDALCETVEEAGVMRDHNHRLLRHQQEGGEVFDALMVMVTVMVMVQSHNTHTHTHTHTRTHIHTHRPLGRDCSWARPTTAHQDPAWQTR